MIQEKLVQQVPMVKMVLKVQQVPMVSRAQLDLKVTKVILVKMVLTVRMDRMVRALLSPLSMHLKLICLPNILQVRRVMRIW